jgi:hypothetical protein
MVGKMSEAPAPTFKAVSTSRLMIDPRYQRPLNEHRAGKIANEFSYSQLGALEVSQRKNRSIAVFDGQHRLTALKSLGIKSAPCLVHIGLSAQEEAELFVRLQRDRRPPTPVERFRAQLFSGDVAAKGIAAALLQSGYVVGTSSNDVKAVTMIERIYAKHGTDVLERVFAIIRDAWYEDPYSLDGSIIGGLGEVLADYGDRWRDANTALLRSQAPVDIKRKAQANRANLGGSAPLAVGAQIRKAAGLRGRPPRARNLELVGA